MAAATVKWTQAEIEEVLDAVSASSIVRGRKKALEELNRAQAKIAANENPKARMTIRFGGWRCHWRGPGGRIDVAFTRWRLAVLVDGSFWHGHPSKWQPGRWSGYWDEKIKRNLARDAAQTMR